MSRQQGHICAICRLVLYRPMTIFGNVKIDFALKANGMKGMCVSAERASLGAFNGSSWL